jgi:hypothetical protein
MKSYLETEHLHSFTFLQNSEEPITAVINHRFSLTIAEAVPNGLVNLVILNVINLKPVMATRRKSIVETHVGPYTQSHLLFTFKRNIVSAIYSSYKMI